MFSSIDWHSVCIYSTIYWHSMSFCSNISSACSCMSSICDCMTTHLSSASRSDLNLSWMLCFISGLYQSEPSIPGYPPPVSNWSTISPCLPIGTVGLDWHPPLLSLLPCCTSFHELGHRVECILYCIPLSLGDHLWGYLGKKVGSLGSPLTSVSVPSPAILLTIGWSCIPSPSVIFCCYRRVVLYSLISFFQPFFLTESNLIFELKVYSVLDYGIYA